MQGSFQSAPKCIGLRLITRLFFKQLALEFMCEHNLTSRHDTRYAKSRHSDTLEQAVLGIFAHERETAVVTQGTVP